MNYSTTQSRNMWVFGMLIILFLGCVAVFGAALDPTFGTGGKVYTSVSGVDSHGRAMMVLPDGKYLVAGYRNQGLNAPEPQLIRYTSDGTLDTSFGNAGVKYWGIQTTTLQVTGAARQADGKIVMVGPGNFNGFQVFRVLADGTIDSGFGTNGRVVISNLGGTNRAYCVLIQPSGKIVVGGSSVPAVNQSPNLVLFRLNTDGTLDSTFGPFGTGISVPGTGIATAITQQTDGKLVTNSSFDIDYQLSTWGDTDMTVRRFTADGVVDTLFGNLPAANGVATIDFGNSERADAIAVQPDGKIIAVGTTRFADYGQTNQHLAGNWAIARFNSDGTRDLSFGSSGRVTLDLDYRHWDSAYSVTVQADGKIIVGGSCLGGAALSRFDQNGALLGQTDHISSHDPTHFVAAPRALYIQPDGKVVAVGDNSNAVGVARYVDIMKINNSTIRFDFDGDRAAELGVYRPGALSDADSYWYGYWSTNITINFSSVHYFQPHFGLGEDIQVPGDYNGDLRTDYAVFRPSNGTWYSSRSPLDDFNANFDAAQWGQAGDIPAPGDFDGDGACDRAVFRPSTGTWYILKSTGGYIAQQFGSNGDKPVTGDYDNDGKADMAVVRDVGGQFYWYILQSSNSAFVAIAFGSTGDRLAPSDFNADGRTEIAVFRPATGTWYLLTNYTAVSAMNWGANGDVPAPGDFDGDGKADFAVFRPAGRTFYVLHSSDQSVDYQFFGLSTDLPITSAYVR
ncbi:MAG: FG-GAP-like repeat-containing protein [Pyrinomonadaceae bacterium]